MWREENANKRKHWKWRTIFCSRWFSKKPSLSVLATMMLVSKEAEISGGTRKFSGRFTFLENRKLRQIAPMEPPIIKREMSIANLQYFNNVIQRSRNFFSTHFSTNFTTLYTARYNWLQIIKSFHSLQKLVSKNFCTSKIPSKTKQYVAAVTHQAEMYVPVTF